MTEAQRNDASATQNDAATEKDDCQCPACKLRRALTSRMEARTENTSTVKSGEDARKLQEEGHPGIGFEIRIAENAEFPFRIKLNTEDGKIKAHYDMRVTSVLQLVDALMSGIDRVAEETGTLPADAIAYMDKVASEREARDRTEASGTAMSDDAIAEALLGCVMAAFSGMNAPRTGRN